MRSAKIIEGYQVSCRIAANDLLCTLHIDHDLNDEEKSIFDRLAETWNAKILGKNVYGDFGVSFPLHNENLAVRFCETLKGNFRPEWTNEVYTDIIRP